MKKIKFIMGLILILVLTGCNKTELLQLDFSTIESISIDQYNFQETITKSKWAYKEEDINELISYLESLKGNLVEEPELDAPNTIAYGVTLNTVPTEYILFIRDYVVLSNGEYYEIGNQKIEDIFNEIPTSMKTYNLTWITNHRYLSLVDGIWDTTYMVESTNKEEPADKIIWTTDTSMIDTITYKLESKITNNSDLIIEFGSMFELEAVVNGTWYRISSMNEDSYPLEFTSELLRIEPGKSSSYSYGLQYYQPLPIGKYRYVKTITMDDYEYKIYLEFEVHNED